MKKLVFGIATLVAVASFHSCQKENISVSDSKITQNKTNNTIRSTNGELVFEDEAHFLSSLPHLAEMSDAERIAWEKAIGFESLLSIEQRIMELENQRIEKFFEGIDPYLTVAEYEAMGLYYQPSEEYLNYLQTGVLERLEEKDGSISTRVSVADPSFHYVLGASRKVHVGDQLYEFNGSVLKVYDNTGAIVKEIDYNSQEKLNGEYNFTRGIGPSGNRGGWINDPARGSNYRYRSFVTFTSSFTTSSLSQNYYWYARAEQRRFGNWATRNNYLPIWGFQASWKFDYWIIYNGDPYGTVIDSDSPLNMLNNSNGYATSPYGLSNLNTNYTIRYLYPHGGYSINPATAGFSFFENVRIYNNSYSSSFTGGASGYSFVLYN